MVGTKLVDGRWYVVVYNKYSNNDYKIVSHIPYITESLAKNAIAHKFADHTWEMYSNRSKRGVKNG